MKTTHLLWGMTIVAGLTLVATLTFHGYVADRDNTSGAITLGEVALAVVFVAGLAAAIVATVRRERDTSLADVHARRAEALTACIGFVLGLVFLPGLLLVLGAMVHAVYRVNRSVPGDATV